MKTCSDEIIDNIDLILLKKVMIWVYWLTQYRHNTEKLLKSGFVGS